MTLEDAENAETLEDAFAALMATAYQDNIEKGTPEWCEARKVFFCGAAFITSRFVQWGRSKDPDRLGKMETIFNELSQFKDDAVTAQQLRRDIEQAGSI